MAGLTGLSRHLAGTKSIHGVHIIAELNIGYRRRCSTLFPKASSAALPPSGSGRRLCCD